jgi:hypothetical protein
MFTIRTSKVENLKNGAYSRQWRVLAPLFLTTLTLVLSSLACNTLTSLVQPEPAASPSPSIQALQGASCPAVSNSIVAAAATVESYQLPDQETRLVTYPIQGSALGTPLYETVPTELYEEQADTSTQQWVWTYFATLIPEQDREFLTEFSVLTDGKDNLLAAVAQSQNDPSSWRLEVDIADAQDHANLTFTLIHEFGHLLTLNEQQVSPSMAVFNSQDDPAVRSHEAAMCPNFFAHEGCSKRDSYLNQFYQRFWTDKYEEWFQVESIGDDYLYYTRLNEFYEKYQDQFVTEYAATNPVEDLAETWAYFILTPMPHGNSIADQKVLFLYEYPELVELRQEIINNLCSAFPQ